MMSTSLFCTQKMNWPNFMNKLQIYLTMVSIFSFEFLVGGVATPLKNMKVNWDDYSQYVENTKMFQSPQTRL